MLPIALASRAGVRLFAGEMAELASLVAQGRVGDRGDRETDFAPDGALTLAALPGREADISALVEAVTIDAQDWRRRPAG